jgi:hypothetical protein
MPKWVLVVAAVVCFAVGAREVWKAARDLRDPQAEWERWGRHKTTGSLSPDPAWVRQRRVSKVLDIVIAVVTAVVIGGYALLVALR